MIRCRVCGAYIPRGTSRCDACQHAAHVASGQTSPSCHDCAMAVEVERDHSAAPRRSLDGWVYPSPW